MTMSKGFSFIIWMLVSSARTTVGSDGDLKVVLAACSRTCRCKHWATKV